MRLASRFLLILLGSISFAACTSTETSNAFGPDVEGVTFATGLGVNLANSTRTSSGLYYRDITVGTGRTVVAGDSVTIRYEGSLVNGLVFDSNLDPAGSRGVFAVTAGRGRLIAGFEEGLLGIKVGGRRQLIIPARLGYGSAGVADASGRPIIPGDAVLVFTVDVISVI